MLIGMSIKRAGFTIVELLVVIIIIGILLTLAVANLNYSQVKARDGKRHSDTSNIASAMENFYTNGSQDSRWKNTYPGTADLDSSEMKKFIDDHIEPASLRAPNVDKDDPISLKMALNNEPSPSAVSPSLTESIYIYQPLTADGELCNNYTDECTSFNIHYLLESSSNECPDKYCTLRSRRS